MTERVLSRRAAERLVEAATAAPSMHNSQPWRFVIRPAEATIEIYADPARTLRHGDPHGRAVHIACGAALFNLRLAIIHTGTEPVTRLLPQPRNPLLLASVRLAGPYRPRPAERDLYAAIGHHPTSRLSLHPHAVPRKVLAELAEAATVEGAALRVLAPPEVVRVLRLTAAADHQLRSDPEYLAELASWTGGARHKLVEGIPGRVPLPRPVAGMAPIRNLSPGHRPPGHPAGVPATRFEAGPQLVAICTHSDDRASWLRAGQAMQHVLLLGTHRGLRASPLTPVLEVPDAPLRHDPAFGGDCPEMILRLGYGPPGPVTPRRPVWQTLRMVTAVPAGEDKRPREAPPPALVWQ